MESKDLLRKLGEETIYSAKGHFKASDLRRNLVTIAIWGCAVSSILDLMNIVNDDRGFDAIGLFLAIALLIWNEGNGKEYRTRHMKTGEKYLAVHKEIREAFFLDESKAQTLSEKVRKIGQSSKPEIPWFARMLAKRAITRNDPETDNWFIQ